MQGMARALARNGTCLGMTFPHSHPLQQQVRDPPIKLHRKRSRDASGTGASAKPSPQLGGLAADLGSSDVAD